MSFALSAMFFTLKDGNVKKHVRIGIIVLKIVNWEGKTIFNLSLLCGRIAFYLPILHFSTIITYFTDVRRSASAKRYSMKMKLILFKYFKFLYQTFYEKMDEIHINKMDINHHFTFS